MIQLICFLLIFRTPRMYRCHCNKNYKTFYGLKNHAKSCNVNLTSANPIDNQLKLIDLKTTVNTNGNTNGSMTTICTSPNTLSVTNQTNKIGSPIMSVSIATTPSTNLSSASNNSELKNQMQEDDPIEGNGLTSKAIVSLKAPTLQQHLLSPIVETKSSAFTSQA